MEPVPETVEALRELTRQGDTQIARMLSHVGRAVREIAPEIVGLSLSFIQENLTFTMTAPAGREAELDARQYLAGQYLAGQYLAGGACDQTLKTGRSPTHRADDPDDEERWQMFAQASASAGIASTLSLPILRGGVVTAGVNLYASTGDAFEGHHAELAAACGAWTGGAVTNADLDFTTRFDAAETPDRIRAEVLIDQAVGALLARSSIDPGEAEDRLRDAARRAGISEAQMARAIVDHLVPRSSER